MSAAPHGKFHRNFYVYADENNVDKCILAASWTFTYYIGQEYFMYSCPCNVSQFFAMARPERSLEYVGKCFWPDAPTSALSADDADLVVWDPLVKYGIASWEAPAIIGFSFPSKSVFSESDLFISFAGDGYYNHFVVSAWQNAAFFTGEAAHKCHECGNNNCEGAGCELVFYDDCDEWYR